MLAREALNELYDLFRDLDRRIIIFDRKIDALFRDSDVCQRIAKIKGITVALAAKIARVAWVILNRPGATYERRDPTMA